MKKLQLIIRYLKYSLSAKGKYSVHAPFLYAFITKILNAKTEEEHQINRRTEFKVTSYELIEEAEDSQTEERFFIN